MPDTSAARVDVIYLLKLADLNAAANYSWDSAILACLYRDLDHDIHLSQYWPTHHQQWIVLQSRMANIIMSFKVYHS